MLIFTKKSYFQSTKHWLYLVDYLQSRIYITGYWPFKFVKRNSRTIIVFQPPQNTSKGWEEDTNGTEEPAKGIKRFRERNNTTNGFVRCDSDPNLVHISLTYKVNFRNFKQ